MQWLVLFKSKIWQNLAGGILVLIGLYRRAFVVHVVKTLTREAEAGGGQRGLPSELQDNLQSNTEEPFLENPKKLIN